MCVKMMDIRRQMVNLYDSIYLVYSLINLNVLSELTTFGGKVE